MKTILLTVVSLMASMSFAAQTPDGEYALDKDHAHVGFSVSHLGFSNVIGRFNTFDGEFKFEANGASSVDFTIDATSVDTNQARRDDHIRSEDFFEVESYPSITFNATEFTYTSEGDPKTITGAMKFHGETKNVTFDVSNVGAGEFGGKKRAGYKATTKISRADFGIETFPGVVGDEIEITVNIEIIQK